jgi:fucose permease
VTEGSYLFILGVFIVALGFSLQQTSAQPLQHLLEAHARQAGLTLPVESIH